MTDPSLQRETKVANGSKSNASQSFASARSFRIAIGACFFIAAEAMVLYGFVLGPFLLCVLLIALFHFLTARSNSKEPWQQTSNLSERPHVASIGTDPFHRIDRKPVKHNPTPASERKNSERRRWVRFRGDISSVRIWVNEQTYIHGGLVDESFGGLGVSVDDVTALEVGRDVTLEYKNTSQDASVRSIHVHGDGAYRVGFQWKETVEKTDSSLFPE